MKKCGLAINVNDDRSQCLWNTCNYLVSIIHSPNPSEGFDEAICCVVHSFMEPKQATAALCSLQPCYFLPSSSLAR